MSWFEETERTFLESLAISVIRCGPIPKHVAFIMDGNRRYANKNHLENVVTGHSRGFDQLTKVNSPDDWFLVIDIIILLPDSELVQ